VGYQQPAQNTNVYAPNMNSLSDDQFLQWGQAAPQPNPYQEANAYAVNNNTLNSSSHQEASNQISRRPMNQMVARPRYDAVSAQQYPNNANGEAEGSDSAWADDIQDLEAKAQVAKREAQSKRKQIPPFVQKLSRYVSPSTTMYPIC
jgi:heat shock transcription factor, other eukaryote